MLSQAERNTRVQYQPPVGFGPFSLNAAELGRLATCCTRNPTAAASTGTRPTSRPDFTIDYDIKYRLGR